MRADIQIKQDVLDQLKYEPILQDAEIGVQVQNGIVTLFGNVNTYLKKINAEKAVKKVQGVKAVAEDIQVLASSIFCRTDTEIAEDVLHALKANTSVPHENIMVKVEDSAVTLEGQVDWEYQRTLANRAIEPLAGIRLINNNLTLRPVTSTENIKQRILEAFHRNATLDAKQISVDITGTKVILKGIVRSFAEREDAEKAAWCAIGITEVENRLRMREDDYVFM